MTRRPDIDAVVAVCALVILCAVQLLGGLL